MMYKHIFFDLDSTLWDFEKNSNKTLLQLIDRFSLLKKGIDTPEDFSKLQIALESYKDSRTGLGE